ncbi:MAG: acyltransferase [Lachnospiraceae bacterium]|nr:acyltransferase [Lachnospiraceae bacterium]
MEQSREKRQSNFELLRILAMLMIVASHYASHGIEKQLVEGEAWQIWLGGSGFARFFTCFLNSGGEVGVALLFAISGYFQIRRDRFSPKKLALSCLYYSVFSLAVLGIVSLLGIGVPYMETRNLIPFLLRSFFMPLTSTLWWFVPVYLFLMLFSPVINGFLRKLNQKGFGLFLLVAWGIWYGLANLVGTEFAQLQKALFFYSLGAFIRLYLSPAPKRRGLYGLMMLAGWAGSAFCFYRLGMLSAGTGGLKTEMLARGFSSLNSMLMVPCLIWGAFRLAQSWRMGYHGWINRLAASTFGIYLIHDSLVIRPLLWYRWVPVAVSQYPSPLFPLWAILTILGIFILCALLDQLRLILFEPAAGAWADRLAARCRQRFMNPEKCVKEEEP